MNIIKVQQVSTGIDGLYITQAGYLALLTPASLKDYISNNRRDKDGREYYTASLHKDDINISVQFVAIPDEDNSLHEILNSLVNTFVNGTNGVGTICGVKCMYKSIGNISVSGSLYVFNANLIKLANQS